MKTIIITPEVQVRGEIETCNLLLESNIERLHVRKPSMTKDELKSYIQQLSKRFYSKVSLHSHHELVDELGLASKHFKGDEMVKDEGSSKSFHSWEEIEGETASLSYGFLSPIFESISKSQYKVDYNHNKLNQQLLGFDRFPIYALGGIDIKKMKQIQGMNFEGVALLGTIWMESSVTRRLEKAKEIINA